MKLNRVVLFGIVLTGFSITVQAQPMGSYPLGKPAPFGYQPPVGLTPIDGFDVPRFYGLPRGWWTRGCSYSCRPVLKWIPDKNHPLGGWMSRTIECDTSGCPGSSPW